MKRKIESIGTCRLCKQNFSYNEIQKHLSACKPYLDDKGNKNVFLIKAEMYPFWVYFEAEENLTLKRVDRFLRELWLECCGHLSAFTIKNQRYSVYEEELDFDEKSMNIKIGNVLEKGTKFNYEYDFGTTTELLLVCISSKTGDNGIRVIARNNLPAFSCEKCGKTAKNVCSTCIWNFKGFVCTACSKKHKCGEEYLLPIVNSPRVGMCGFTGDACKLLNS